MSGWNFTVEAERRCRQKRPMFKKYRRINNNNAYWQYCHCTSSVSKQLHAAAMIGALELECSMKEQTKASIGFP